MNTYLRHALCIHGEFENIFETDGCVSVVAPFARTETTQCKQHHASSGPLIVGLKMSMCKKRRDGRVTARISDSVCDQSRPMSSASDGPFCTYSSHFPSTTPAPCHYPIQQIGWLTFVCNSFDVIFYWITNQGSLPHRVVRALGWRVRSLFRRPPEDRAQVAEQPPVDLGVISATIHHGCMGLPQELINEIVDILHDDLRALKACSLTCKAMFASTRHLIHQTLYLTAQNNQSVLTREEGQKLLNETIPEIKLRFVSHMGEHFLLRYARRVCIRKCCTFTPESLLPHIHHFQSLDRVHTLTIENYNAPSWENHYNTCFVHFYPTLTSLTLSFPFSRYRPLLQFALQFPNLENLCLEWLPLKDSHIPEPTIPTLVERSPPLCGHLRLAGYGTTGQEPVDFTHEIPNGFNFRTVELEAFFGDGVQHILEACANTLENLTIFPLGVGKHLLSLAVTKLLAHLCFPQGMYS